MTETVSETRRQVLLARAWKRCLMDETGTRLNSDGRLIVQALLRKADFFGRQQDPNSPTLTYIKCAKREFVIDILAYLNLKEEALSTLIDLVKSDD